jgi:2-polyprenyl-3-methyl-5-hydroxy-6-metoxy-1,4-benzoquinol methylase
MSAPASTAPGPHRPDDGERHTGDGERHTGDGERRTGDALAIPGDYQHRALTDGPRVQRAWHRTKLGLLDWFFLPVPGERVLDVGCGAGVFADRLAAAGCEVVGVDANAAAVAYARRTFARPGLRFQLGLLDELDLPAGAFDAATCLEVVEHVHPPQVAALLADLRRLVRPGGRVLVTTPNYRGTWPAIEWLADRAATTAHMDGAQHVNRYHRARLVRALEEAGFAVERVRAFSTFAPFVAALSSRAAAWAERVERAVDLPFGNLLAAAARNR